MVHVPPSRRDQEIRSVSEFIAHLDVSAPGKRRLFRGQNTDEPLLPGIIRLAKMNGFSPAKIDTIEREMFDRFKRESLPMLEIGRELQDWELLSVAQHRGTPTRLLDWTENALAALWFAVAEDPPPGKDEGIVWVVENPNEKTFQPGDDVFKLDRTYFFQPPHVDRRIAAQAAWFSAYRHNTSTIFMPLDEQERYDSGGSRPLTRYVVPRGCFETIRRQLRLLGIHHATLFPDLTGLGLDITAEHFPIRKGISPTATRGETGEASPRPPARTS